MELNSTDIALLYALRTWGKGNVTSELRNIISFYDYYDHSILSYNEFQQALSKLIGLGLVTYKEETIQPSKEYTAWWTKKYSKKRPSLQKELDELKIYATKHLGSIDPPIKTTEFELWEEEFKMALQLYQPK